MTIFDAFGHLAPIVSLRGLPVAQDYYHILQDEVEERVANGIGAITDERYRLIWDKSLLLQQLTLVLLITSSVTEIGTARMTTSHCH